MPHPVSLSLGCSSATLQEGKEGGMHPVRDWVPLPHPVCLSLGFGSPILQPEQHMCFESPVTGIPNGIGIAE